MQYNCGKTVVDVDFVCDVARLAGNAIMQVYNAESETWDTQLKGDNSPLTRADLSANEVICSKLQERYPDIPIISEENKLLDYSVRKTYQYYFVVDPLDGTKEFIKRNGQFTVNIGLCDGQTPVLGVVYIPAAEIPKIYFAVKGQGAYVEDEAERYPTKIHVKEFSEDEEGLSVVASASHNTPETEAFISKYKNATLKNMGSSIKLLLVAEGQAHIYPRLAPTCEWDTCASHAIVLEAGGEVLQMPGGADATEGVPVIYNKEHPLNPFFVVYGKRKSGQSVPVDGQTDLKLKAKIDKLAREQSLTTFAVFLIVVAIAAGLSVTISSMV